MSIEIIINQSINQQQSQSHIQQEIPIYSNYIGKYTPVLSNIAIQ